MAIGSYQTWHIKSPRSTHTRPATCQEVECPNYANGWRTTVDESTPLGKRQAEYIRAKCGRRFREGKDTVGLTVFIFFAEQPCFSEHRLPIGIPPIFANRDGDWRGNPTGRVRVFGSGEEWADAFATEQDQINRMKERG